MEDSNFKIYQSTAALPEETPKWSKRQNPIPQKGT